MGGRKRPKDIQTRKKKRKQDEMQVEVKEDRATLIGLKGNANNQRLCSTSITGNEGKEPKLKIAPNLEKRMIGEERSVKTRKRKRKLEGGRILQRHFDRGVMSGKGPDRKPEV